MAIFDGHGGSSCSDFCKNNFVNNFLQNKFTKMNQIQLGIAEAIILTDKQFCTQFFHLQNVGSTAALIVVDVQQRLVFYTNVGDSRIIIGQKGSYATSDDHKPSAFSEQQRLKNDFQSQISELYGIKRVNGMLSISRSIGDPSQKIYGIVSECQNYKPLKIYDIEYTLIGSDGLFDVLSNDILDSIVRNCLQFETNNINITDDNLYSKNEKEEIIQAAIQLYNLDNNLDEQQKIQFIKHIDSKLIQISKNKEITEIQYDTIPIDDSHVQKLCQVLCHIAYALGSIDNITTVISIK